MTIRTFAAPGGIHSPPINHRLGSALGSFLTCVLIQKTEHLFGFDVSGIPLGGPNPQ